MTSAKPTEASTLAKNYALGAMENIMLNGGDIRHWGGSCRVQNSEEPQSSLTYGAVHSSYSLKITVKDYSPFRAVPVTVTSGPMKGLRVIVLVPTGHFRFMDLPVEIRTIVYSMIFEDAVPEGQIKLKTYKPQKHKMRLVQETFQSGNADARFDCDLRKWKTRNPSALNLLQTNRQIYKEAVPMLYKERTFIFVDANALNLFNRVSLRGIKNIRFLELRDAGKYSIRRLAGDMTRAVRLQAFRLPHSLTCMNGSARNPPLLGDTLACYFHPLLRALSDFIQSRGLDRHAVDVFSSSRCDCQYCGHWETNVARAQIEKNPHCACEMPGVMKMYDKIFWAKFRAKAVEDLRNIQ